MPRRSKFFAVMNVHVPSVREQYIKIQKNFEGSCEEHGPFIFRNSLEISE